MKCVAVSSSATVTARGILWRRGAWLPPLLSVMGVAAAATGPAGCSSDPEPLSVMTRNLYLGADLTPLFSALTVDDLSAGAAKSWSDVQASLPGERAAVLADEIVAADPDVVALQEATLFRIQSPGDWQSGDAPNAEDVRLDLLQLLLDALASRGAHYQPATVGTFTDDEIPALGADGTSFDVRLTDRNAILVREGLRYQSGPMVTFDAAAAIPVGGPGGATLTLRRGFVSADVTVGSKGVRVVDSHLEVGQQLGRTQEEQAHELIASLAPYGSPLVLAGDFNSPPDGSDTTTYALLTTTTGGARPFHDAWQFRQDKTSPGMLSGFTCCVDLEARDATPQQRIDLVLFRGTIQPADARSIQPSRTSSGLWPSDHLGVVAELQLP